MVVTIGCSSDEEDDGDDGDQDGGGDEPEITIVDIVDGQATKGITSETGFSETGF